MKPPDLTDLTAAWEFFQFKHHPEVLETESDENSDDDAEYLQKLMQKYHSEVLRSDSDDETTTDDEITDVDNEDTDDDDKKTIDEDFEELMMKMRKKRKS